MRVGIDLGTTTSTIVRLGPDGRPAQKHMTPSLCAWRNGHLMFGGDAVDALWNEETPAFPIRDIKMSLGKESIKVGGLSLDVERVLVEFLRYLASKVALREEIEEAVIGTPVSVSEAHRLALIDSARKAGFGHVRLVYEPTSALVGAIEPRRMHRHSLALVVDWGGGTLDLSLIRKNGDSLQEVAVDGDLNKLGGSQMDSRILHKILARTPGVKEKLASIPEGHDRLKVEIEREKTSILESPDPETDDIEIAPFWLGRTVELKGKEVVEVAQEMADQAAEQIVDFLIRSNVGLSEVTHVLFAGGVCKSPLVRERLLEVLPDVEVVETSIPQQLTGYGCARLLGYGFELRLASDFGVRQSDESFCTLLPAGHDIGLGTYRSAAFMVTDATAYEAVLDLGIIAASEDTSAMLATSAEGFVSLKTLFIRCQQTPGQLKGGSWDYVRVYAGISHALVATVFAESNVGADSRADTISGIPFLIRLNGLA